MANGRIDLTGHVILIVEEQPIVALNMQIAAEEAGGEAIIARGPNEALARLHQFMVSAAVIDPRRHALISELQSRQIRVVLKSGSTAKFSPGWQCLRRMPQAQCTSAADIGACKGIAFAQVR